MIARGQIGEAGKPLIRNYTVKEYGAANQNWVILQDDRNIIYVGNSSGLLEYDGVSWRLRTLPNQYSVRSLAKSEKGRLYVGGVGEFGYLVPTSNGQLDYVSLLNKLKPEDREFTDIWKSYSTTDGIYFQEFGTIYRWKDEQFKVWKVDTKFRLYSFWIQGKYYVQQREIGLLELVDDHFEVVSEDPILKQTSVDVMLPYDDNQILLGTRNQGLFLFDGTLLRPFPNQINDFLSRNNLYRGTKLSNGDFALATLNGGMVIIDKDGQLKEMFNSSTGFVEDQIYYIYEDRQGGLWLGTGNGISRIETLSPFSIFDRESGLRSDAHGIVKHDNLIYVATKLGIDELNPAEFLGQRPQFKPIKESNDFSFKLLSTDKGLLATTLLGTYEIKNHQAMLIYKSNDGSFFLTRSKKNPNRFFVGNRNAVAVLRFTNGIWSDEGRIPVDNIGARSLVEDTSGKLWVGSESSGVVRLDFSQGFSLEPKIERFGQESGLPGVKCQVFSVDGREIFGTDRGLYRIEPSTKRFLPDGIFGKTFTDSLCNIYYLTEDIHKNVWIAYTYDGKSEFGVAVCQADDSYVWEDRPFKRINGLLRFNDENTIFVDSNSVVWLSSSAGLLRYDPRIPKNYLVDFPTLIRRVIVNNDSIIFNGFQSDDRQPLVILPYEKNALRFEFAAASFDDESANKYQYFLEGFDKEWSEWTKESRKDYTNLPGGIYHFRVRARNIYDHQGEETLYTFKILNPFWLSWWFIGLIILLIAVLSFSGYKYRTNMLYKRALQLEYLINERTKKLEEAQQQIIKLEKDNLAELMAGGFAHEMRNALSGSVILLSAVVNDANKDRIVTSCQNNTENLDKLFGKIEDYIPDEYWETACDILDEIYYNEKTLDEVLRMMRRSVNRAMAVTNLILEYSRINRAAAGQSKINLVELMEKALAEHQNEFQTNNIEIELNLAAEHFVRGHESHFNLILNHLVTNARDALLEIRDDRQRKIEITLLETDREQIIKITDNGSGITAENLAKIFEPFFSTKPTTGTGLGLSMISKLVHLYHGTIDVKSEVGKKTIFTVTLPIQNSTSEK